MMNWIPLKFLPLLVFLLFVGNSVRPFERSADADQDRIHQIESKLAQEKKKLEAFHTKERDLLSQLSGLEREVSERKRAIEEFKGKLDRIRAGKEQLKSKLAESDRVLRQVEGQLSERLVALYKCARRGYVKLLASAEDLDQLRGRIKYARSVMEEDRRVLGDLAKQRNDSAGKVAALEERIAQVEAGEREERDNLTRANQELQAKVILLMNVHKEKEFYETAVKELNQAAEDLKRAMVKVRHRKSDVDKWQGRDRFSDSRGKLQPPLDGKILKSEQFLGAADLTSRRGIFIEGGPETEVKAVFDGRVDFSGRLKGYGDVIVVNHGARYFTISALLSQRLKQEGDLVRSGEVIGRIAGGGSKGPGLYFEIRKADENLDPLKWLKLP